MSGFGAPSGTGAGGELTAGEELWVITNSGKNVIDSSTAGSERVVTNLVEDGGTIKVTHDD